MYLPEADKPQYLRIRGIKDTDSQKGICLEVIGGVDDESVPHDKELSNDMIKKIKDAL